MSDTAIKVEGLGKKYRLGGTPGAVRYNYKSLRDVVSNAVTAPFRRQRNSNENTEEFWALKDVSFEVKQGEVVGIIGRNGAGKSTMLKVLSRITDPSAGRVEVLGRVGSLLEVGTGFHPELTGRENIYLNGAILGMRKREIDRKFDEIVAFAETEKFLDTAVKFYSSGMYMRLAFAVAAHLEPEILVVDEVLAVGDLEFQKKCMGKMSEVAGQGRTVLLVSHNIGAVMSLCTRALMLRRGSLVEDGRPAEVVQSYAREAAALSGQAEIPPAQPTSREPIKFTDVSTRGANGEVKTDFMMGEAFCIRFGLRSIEMRGPSSMTIDVKTVTGIRVLHIVCNDAGFLLEPFVGERWVEMRMPNFRCYPGQYVLSVWVGDPTGCSNYHSLQDCLTITVHPGAFLKRDGLSWNQALYLADAQWGLSD
jgi:lipopolysaccharide transport system ATP-binding protein